MTDRPYDRPSDRPSVVLPRPAPGAVERTLLDLDLGHPVRLPRHVLRGRRDGPTLLVTAGIHGAEYASIEAADRVARLDPDALAGTLVVLPIVDPAGFAARRAYTNPIDGRNLNRMFPGDPEGTFTERLAAWLLETHVRGADAWIDLHGGDLVEALTPFTIHSADDAAAASLAEAFGLRYRIASSGEGVTYAAGSAVGVPSIIAEASGQGLRPEPEIARLVDGVRRSMASLGMLDESFAPAEVERLTRFEWRRAEREGMWFPAVDAGDEVAEGETLGEIRDLLGGDPQRIASPVAGPVLFLASALAVGEGDPLIGIGAP